MKKIVIAIIAVAVVVTGSIFVIAQKRSGEGGGHNFGHGRGGKMGIALRSLDLTDEQKAKFKEIMEANKVSFEPTRQAMKLNRSKLRDLGKNGTFDQDQVEVLAKEQGDLVARSIVQRESVKAQIFAILTDEQKAKAVEMRAKFEERSTDRKGFGGKHRGSEFEVDR